MSNNVNRPYYYDKELYTLSCYSYMDLLTTISLIKTKGKTIDINTSVSISPYSVYYEDKTYKNYYAWYELFAKLEEDFGIEVNLNKCSGGSEFFLSLKKPMRLNTDPVLKEVVVETIGTLVDIEVEAAKVSSEEVSTSPSIQDLSKLLNEDDLRGSKNKLEDEVKRAYGIDLRKNQTFQNMLKQLTEELANL